MLTKCVFTSLVLVAGALTQHLDDPVTPTDDSYVGPHIDVNTGYNELQVEQIHQSSNDAVKFVRMTVDAKRDETFDLVFQRYFHIDDHDFVINVLNALLNHDIFTDSTLTGKAPKLAFDANYHLGAITVVADHPDPNDENGRKFCDDVNNADQLQDPNLPDAKIVLCPQAFKLHSCLATDCDTKHWPDVKQVSCDNVGAHVSIRMMTLSYRLLKLYTYYEPIMSDALKDAGGSAQDLVQGPRDVLNIDRETAKKNADSYAWFATEMAWTLYCNRSFGRADYKSD